MVRSPHEAMHRLFQHDPGVFTRAFHELALPFDDPLEVALLSTDLTESRPIERRVDTVMRIVTASGSFLLLVEAQGDKDPDKPASWAYYLSHLLAKFGLPPVLLVVCQDQSTATWAAGPWQLGPPQWSSLVVRPLVLGPHNVPEVTDVETAAADIPLAALSAITHAKAPGIGAILKALVTALRDIGNTDEAQLFAELTELGLSSSPAIETWRKLMTMDLSFFRSETSQRLRAEGVEKGHAAGHAEGLADGLLRVLSRRGIVTDDNARARIKACADQDQLNTWLDRSLAATTIADLFADET
ncbi:hypothetical protein [Nocardia sp. NBC_01009]|uniref:hypothetical protein n=1 Tax=Nocardia sp. NBC_01009 TaxID=2975996 RepID=UPI0038653BCA|nr:hypothetical protein OHA42_34765 [Nocardia sp. NBC_01009]